LFLADRASTHRLDAAAPEITKRLRGILRSHGVIFTLPSWCLLYAKPLSLNP
jgi:hypothetical protein